VSDIAKRMSLVVCAGLSLLVGGSALFYRSWAFLPFAGGALLGAALSIAKIMWLDRTVKNAASMEAQHAGNYVRLQSLFRFLLTGLVLALPAVAIQWGASPGLFWGAAAGVLVHQLAVYSLKLPTKKSRR